VDGAPERAVAARPTAAGQLLFTPASAPLTAQELGTLRAAQEARGRTVSERSPGIYVIERIAPTPEKQP
jgi:hypothetical protein